MKRIVIILSLLSSSSAFAELSSQATRQAEIYFEAGDYTMARNQYESLLDDSLDSWQREILLYDIGTVLLSQEQWQDALTYFQKALDLNQNLPLVQEQLLTNITLAKLMLANEQMRSLTQKASTHHTEEYGATISLYREILTDINTARQAQCRLAEIEGAKTCTPSLPLETIYTEAKNGLAASLQAYTSYLISSSSMQEGTSSLLAAVKSIKGDLNFLKDFSVNEASLKSKYSTVYLSEANTWQPLWKALEEKLSSHNDDLSKEQFGLFEKAKKEFSASLSSLSKQEFESSLTSINESQTTLKSLLSLIFEHTTIKEALQQLLASYDHTLIQDPLKEIDLESLKNEQQGLKPLLQASSKPDLINDYQQAQTYWTKGWQALQKEEALQAKIFIFLSQHYIENVLEQFGNASKHDPEAILKQTIKAEEFSLVLTRLVKQTSEQETLSKDINELLGQILTKPQELSKAFLPAAQEQQQKAFSSKTSLPTPSSSWDEVISLFLEGQQLSKNAIDQFSKRPENLPPIITLQMQAIEKWKAALAKLHASKAESETSPQSQKASPEKQPQPKPEASQGSSLSEILHQLQEMEDDDKSHPTLKSVPSNMKEEKPW